ncbi:MAG: alpha/beta hydrolase [Planctomycetes bacterium]|nr:alpha/beta hydrolase [Planctomycetota bacterium]
MSPAEGDAFLARLAANRAWEAARPRFLATFWPSQQAHDARSWTGDLDLPILVFIGQNGQRLPADLDGWRQHLGMERARRLAVEMIPRVGHWMMLDDPDRVGSALLAYLDQICPGAPQSVSGQS